MRAWGGVAGLFGDSIGPLFDTVLTENLPFGQASGVFSARPPSVLLHASRVAWGRGR